MKYTAAICMLIFLFQSCKREQKDADLTTPFEQSDSTETATYEQGIAWWKTLAASSPFVEITEFGESDAPHALHLVKVEVDPVIDGLWRNDEGKLVLLINNGIHPGEPDGIDASMIFARELIRDPDFSEKYKDVILLIIPFYNVGGALNRNCCSRANQNGPPSYGFRGNARNLDLNRDFIKNDSRNALSFSRLIRDWDPDIYLETHVSNGADYRYTMTYLLSQTDKMMPSLKEFCTKELEPHVMASMQEKGDECIPYVNVWGTTPDSGYTMFYDLPRYSTGYLNLFNTIGLLSETHMLKPFKRRVSSTLNYMRTIAEFVSGNTEQIKKVRMLAADELLGSDSLALDWKVDRSRCDSLNFKGYRAYFEKSEVTGAAQLYYDGSAPWEKKVPYYRYFLPVLTVDIPRYYVVPVSWGKVVELLENNGVYIELIKSDTALEVEQYRLLDFETSPGPYEGHYFHTQTSVDRESKVALLRKNEYLLISTNQRSRRFLVEVLEPHGPDSYFNWNFFDEVLQQKEWFSSYVFDLEAKELLKDKQMKNAFDSLKKAMPELKGSATGQLYEIYKMSERYERDRHLVYPVFRVN
ncbi:MAG: M14 family zinc carboxypeptidase [Vicingaceae bacterium]